MVIVQIQVIIENLRKLLQESIMTKKSVAILGRIVIHIIRIILKRINVLMI